MITGEPNELDTSIFLSNKTERISSDWDSVLVSEAYASSGTMNVPPM